MVHANANDAPSWVTHVDKSAANFVGGTGTSTQGTTSSQSMSTTMMHMRQSTPIRRSPGGWFVPLLVALMLFVCIGAMVKGSVRAAAIWVGIVLSLIFWVIGQNVGSYYTGLATDPNSGPLLVLLGVAILGCTNLDTRLQTFLAKTEDILL